MVEHAVRHLCDSLTSSRGCERVYQPSVDRSLGEAAHRLRTRTYLLWSEIADDLELEERETIRLAAEHVALEGLQQIQHDEADRRSVETRVTNEDCYQLHSQGLSWPDVAQMAGVSIADAQRHAATFAWRCRRPDPTAETPQREVNHE